MTRSRSLALSLALVLAGVTSAAVATSAVATTGLIDTSAAQAAPLAYSAETAAAPDAASSAAVVPDAAVADAAVTRAAAAGAVVLADDGARIVVALGDVTRADRIVILVPGVGTTRRSLTEGSNAMLDQAAALRTAADELAESTSAETRLAVIAFLGYQPPDDVGPGALSLGPAQAGGRELAALTDWLPESARLTWICHSYGAMVCGSAVGQGQRAPADIVLLGAPGTGHDTAAEFAPSRVWAATAPDDGIWLAGIAADLGLGSFGPLPSDPAFGARELMGSGGGHSGYLRPGSSYLPAIAAIALGSAR